MFLVAKGIMWIVIPVSFKLTMNLNTELIELILVPHAVNFLVLFFLWWLS